MPNVVLSPPPSYVKDTSDYIWTKWLNELFERIGTSGAISIRGFKVAGLPNPAAFGGAEFSSLIYVSNESGGPTIAFSDGTNWRRVIDNAIVS